MGKRGGSSLTWIAKENSLGVGGYDTLINLIAVFILGVDEHIKIHQNAHFKCAQLIVYQLNLNYNN